MEGDFRKALAQLVDMGCHRTIIGPLSGLGKSVNRHLALLLFAGQSTRD